ncbi:MAG: PHP domain-containing protein, partial [Clostridia bacterium]|nr:PHP domain-containing protein [Clostridia bacterium]
YAGRVKFFTGGSDYHNDAKKGVKDARYLGERGISYDHFLKIKEWLVP